ncbi:hypothetical protein CYMTET_21190 [Cymbomonas tetramitiformis]|uniref:Uncharacterized protein n=1 Tax=Cymbomonas tetramitiformis TaxID=36881 RepID=A0AAE0G2N6_9CHLO|nr:hypothetical protein CYMTET_21190 [Cymbomonas tetramitiformis]
MPAECQLGPRGLPLPSWNPAFAEEKAKAERERAEFFKETDEHTKKEYGSKEYWQAFEFGGDADVEWLCSEEVLLPLLPSPTGGSRALVVGCGTSSVSRDLLDVRLFL